jgi:hypothetical protein
MNREHSVFHIQCAAVSSSDDDNNCSRRELRFHFTSEQHHRDGLTGSLCSSGGICSCCCCCCCCCCSRCYCYSNNKSLCASQGCLNDDNLSAVPHWPHSFTSAVVRKITLGTASLRSTRGSRKLCVKIQLLSHREPSRLNYKDQLVNGVRKIIVLRLIQTT